MPPVPALSNQFARARASALVASQQRTVAIAKARNAAVMQREPRPVSFLRYVDGRLGVLEEAVKVAGVIRYVYIRRQVGFERELRATRARLDEIADFALQTLRSISPVGSGRDPHPGQYRDSHQLFLNGLPVDNLSGWQDGDEISISNAVEYSRILEIGDRKARLPLLVYERAGDIVEEHYGKDAKVRFTWRGIVNGRQFGQKGLRPRAKNKSKLRYPTIVITPFAIDGRLLRDVLNAGIYLGTAALLASASYPSLPSPSMPLLNAPGTIDHQ